MKKSGKPIRFLKEKTPKTCKIASNLVTLQTEAYFPCQSSLIHHNSRSVCCKTFARTVQDFAPPAASSCPVRCEVVTLSFPPCLSQLPSLFAPAIVPFNSA